MKRYSRAACVFVNTGEGKRLRLRGIYARVVKDGRLSLGNTVSKLSAKST
jgi:MOSC domain-containing protein YiiM